MAYPEEVVMPAIHVKQHFGHSNRKYWFDK